MGIVGTFIARLIHFMLLYPYNGGSREKLFKIGGFNEGG